MSCCFRGTTPSFRAIIRHSLFPATASTTTSFRHHHHHHHHHSFSSSTTRTQQRLLLQTEFQRHGYKLANINPLEESGFLADATMIRESLPDILRPLVSIIADFRKRNDCNYNNQINRKDFVRVVTEHFIKDITAATAITPTIAAHDLEWCLEKYCTASGMGLDFDHCHSEQERFFFTNYLFSGTAATNNHGQPNHHGSNSNSDELLLLWAYEQLLQTRAFVKFMSERYPTTRRFGIEGLDATIPAINAIIHFFGEYENDDDDDRTTTRNDRGHYLDSTTNNQKMMKKRIVLGTQHRGRIDFLAHILQIPLPDLIQKWDLTDGPTYTDICSGYHRDVTTTTTTKNDNNTSSVVHISMLPIPAHLEAMNAVVSGKARAHAMALQNQQAQRRRSMDNGDGNRHPWNDDFAAAAATRRQVLPVTIHGDASVCGQGIVSETLQLGTCHDYECGGTIRLVLDNQIGFTTEQNKIRNHHHNGMTPLVSDVGKSIGAPIFHVNARLVNDVIRAAQIAVRYRQEFGKDVFLHLHGWREHGHNELDDPHATNVLLYQKVDSQIPVIDTFRQRLLQDDDNTSGMITNSILDEIKVKIDDDFAQVKALKRTNTSWNSTMINTSHHGPIQHSLRPKSIIKTTSVDQKLLDEASFRLTNVPDGFQLHPFVRKIIEARKKALLCTTNNNSNSAEGRRVDWATAELLALTTLNLQGIKCRLSGQDVQRGTFFQRHGVWHDISSGKEYHPLAPGVEICNSPLSEFGVLSFEYGYSVARPADSLVLWEAQFGDFVNGAQAFLDAVLSSSDEKWGMQSSLTLLLPHGYDGMGPEHSSCRLERWLQLFSSHLNHPTKDDNNDGEESKYKSANMSVTYPSSPANYFHLLRRQLTWSFRRPLIVLTPKRTLRLAAAASSKSEFLANTSFQPILDDPRMSADTTATNLVKERIAAVLLCSGELYYDLVQLREKSLLSQNVAIVRLEELAPFPIHELNNILAHYNNVRSIAWVQEEPANQGARDFVFKHLQSPDFIVMSRQMKVTCLSRPEAAAPAVGTPHGHQASQEKLMSDIQTWSSDESALV